MPTSNLRDQLREFILENYLFTDDQNELSDDSSFLETGILDSMGVLELIAFLNEDLGVKVETGEMVPENLDGIDRLLTFIEKKQA